MVLHENLVVSVLINRSDKIVWREMERISTRTVQGVSLRGFLVIRRMQREQYDNLQN